ncbi:MAG: hypothetical protein WCI71_15865 [Bacteroidota bacterium]
MIDSDGVEDMCKKIKTEIQSAIHFAKKSDFPNKDELFAGIFAK